MANGISLSDWSRERSEMDKRLDFVFRRRSIRKYAAAPIAENDVKSLLEAGMAAPSASNLKPWHFVVVMNRAKLNELAEAHEYGKMLAEAGLAIAVCGDPKVSERYWDQDGAAATENILLACEGLGLGAVWLGCHPRTERKAAIRKVLGIPDSIEVLSLLSIGHPGEKKPARTQYDETRVHREGW
jgi:nitroreductase